MNSNYFDHSDSLHECPKCGKHALARISDQRYQCVWCRFYRDFSNNRGSDGSFGSILLFLVGLFVVFLLAGNT